MTPDFPFDEHQIDPQRLKAALDAAFDDAALRDLCFALGVGYEDDLDAGNTGVKKRSLVQVMQQRRQLAVLAQEIVRRRSQFTAGSFSRDTRSDDSPFKGLEFYREADAHLFFGREALTQTLLTHLLPPSPSEGEGRGEGKRFLAVVGASGSGKSSVVRAGLVPALRRQADWPIHIITPTAQPLEALATTLTQNSESVTATTTLIDDLATDERSLHLYVRRLLGDFENRPTRLLLVIDQFEELFTLCKDEAARQVFVDNLVHAVADASAGPTVVVLTLRADFYHRCLQYESLHALLEQQQKIVPAMSATELRAAIAQPAVNADLQFEDGLVELLLRDVGATDGGTPEPGALPLLSHALLETWRRRDGNRLTLAGYQAAGGVQGAIAQTAESVYQSLDAGQKQIARNIFLRLTELGEGTQDTRRRAAVSELLPQGESRPQVDAVLRRLADARLLTTDRSEDSHIPASFVEVAHEALIREWPTLRDWLHADRAGLHLYHQLIEAARTWNANSRKNKDLYFGTRLENTLEWKKNSALHISEMEETFLTTSQQHEARAIRRENLGRFILFFSTLLVIGMLVYLIINDQNQDIEEQRRRKIALAQSLIAHSEGVFDQYNDTELATLLAIEGTRLNWEESGEFDWLFDELLRLYLGSPVYFNTTFNGHESGVLSIAFSPDGDRFASGDSHGKIRLLNLSQLEAEPVILPNPNVSSSIWSLAFSPDGKLLASVSNNEIHLRNLRNLDEEPVVLRGHENYVLSLVFSAGGDLLASSSADATIRLWNLTQLDDEPIVLQGHDSGVWSIALSPDGKLLASGGGVGDQIIRLWNLDGVLSQQTTEPVILHGHNADIRSLAFSPDGKILVSGSDDHTIRLWNLSDLKTEPTILNGHSSGVWSLAFSPTGEMLASASSDKTIRLWDLSRSIEQQQIEQVAVLKGHENWVRSIAFSPDGKLLASGSEDQSVRLWDLSKPATEPIILDGHELTVSTIAFSPNSKLLASGSEDQTIRLWDLSEPITIPTVLTGHDGWVRSVVFSPRGDFLVSGSEDQTIRLWPLYEKNLTLREEPAVLRGHEGLIRTVAFSPNGEILASGSEDNTVRLWNLNHLETEPEVLHGGEFGIWSVAFSPDERILASADAGSSIRLWYLLQSKVESTVLNEHDDLVYSVAFSPDGEMFASGSRDNTLRIWNLSNPRGESVAMLSHDESVWSVAFSPDGKTIASGSADSLIRLWNVSQLEAEPIKLRGHEAKVFSVAFSPDGMYLASGSSDKTIRLWILLEGLVEIGCQKVRRNLTQAEWARYLPGEGYRRTCPNLPPGG